MILMERRNADGAVVTLRIDSVDRISIRVDEADGARFEIPARSGPDALEVFHHPYAYAEREAA
jgi:hypothetical protein